MRGPCRECNYCSIAKEFCYNRQDGIFNFIDDMDKEHDGCYTPRQGIPLESGAKTFPNMKGAKL